MDTIQKRGLAKLEYFSLPAHSKMRSLILIQGPHFGKIPIWGFLTSIPKLERILFRNGSVTEPFLFWYGDAPILVSIWGSPFWYGDSNTHISPFQNGDHHFEMGKLRYLFWYGYPRIKMGRHLGLNPHIEMGISTSKMGIWASPYQYGDHHIDMGRHLWSNPHIEMGISILIWGFVNPRFVCGVGMNEFI